MVAQHVDFSPGGEFDLVIATNIFPYYNFLEQALAMQNITRMMNPRGIFLVKQFLSNQHADSLKFIDQCNVPFNRKDLYGDDVVAYQQQSAAGRHSRSGGEETVTTRWGRGPG